MKTKVITGKIGLDDHYRGILSVNKALTDAGMEVVYTGIRQTPEMIAEAAVQEDVDVVGLSILSGAHMALFPRDMELLRENDMGDVLVVAGGIIPDEDVSALNEMGIEGIFGPGTRTDAIVEFIRENVA